MKDEELNPRPIPDIREADRLYREFPDFSSWTGLTDSDRNQWARSAEDLEVSRAAAVVPESFQNAVAVAIRAAAIDTGAIEGLYDVERGFTMTVATQAVAWQHEMDEKGPRVRHLFEAQLEAYELVLDAMTRRIPVTEAWIRALHEQLCGPQDTYRVETPLGWQEQELVKGQYKTQPNHVRLKDGRLHAYSPVDRVPEQMHRLVQALGHPEFEAGHPILQASYSHFALVNVHPFPDGNGRVARALASLFYYRALSIPLVVFAEQKASYLDALHDADEGKLRPLLAFFRDRGMDTMNLVSLNLKNAALSPVLSDAVGALKRLHARREGLSPYDLDRVALRLQEALKEEIGKQLEDLELPENISFKITEEELNAEPPTGYRRVSSSAKKVSALTIQSAPPAASSVRMFLRVTISREASEYYAFRCEAFGWSDFLEIRLEEVYPEIGNSFRFRLRSWVESFLAIMLKALAVGASQSFDDFK